jgi:glycosyltransferase involved in cell wall biosynthesis
VTVFVIEANCFQGPRRHRGIGRYTESLIAELHRRGSVRALVYNADLGPPAGDVPLPTSLWRPNTRRELRKLTADGKAMYLVTSPFELGAPASAALPVGVHDLAPVGTIVYDMIPFRYPEHYLADPVLAARHHSHLTLLADCDIFFAISEFTRRDVMEFLRVAPDRVVSIGAGVPNGFGRPEPGALRAGLAHAAVPAVDRPYVFTVGASDWRKNIPGLLEAWALLDSGVRRRYRLVVTCERSLPTRHIWDELATKLKVTSSVIFTDQVSESTLRLLYQGTALFVFPSRCEGFGFPPLEAMACGVPTIMGSNSSLIEIASEDALFDAESPASIARAIDRGLTDVGHQAALRAAGDQCVARHTWADTAERLEEAAASRASTRPAVSRRRRARIALVGPFLPARTGVGVYNSRVVDCLARRADVDCFVEGDWRKSVVPAGSAFPISALREARRASEYDAVVAVLGNSAYHARTYEVVTQLPTMTWFHDVNLTGLHRERSELRRPHDPASFMLEQLRACYGDQVRVPPRLLDPYDLASEGLFMAAEAAAAASRTIVSSTSAASLLVLDTAGSLRSDPLVLPLAFPDVRRGHARPNSSDEALIVSLGYVHEIKRPQVLVDALQLLASSRRVSLVFAGPDALRDRRPLWDRVRAAGLQDRLTITGWLSDKDYLDWTERADIVVQLRERSYGESSAAVTEAMALGRPVVTSVGACADFPCDTHVQVPGDVTAETLATELAALLDDDERRTSMQDSAKAFARQWSFDRVAAKLVDLALEDARP